MTCSLGHCARGNYVEARLRGGVDGFLVIVIHGKLDSASFG